jgi:hypothetical protein
MRPPRRDADAPRFAARKNRPRHSPMRRSQPRNDARRMIDRAIERSSDREARKTEAELLFPRAILPKSRTADRA